MQVTGTIKLSGKCCVLINLAPRPGLEPGTLRLTAARSTIELPGNTLAAEPGFEPGLRDSKSPVLPLHNSAIDALRPNLSGGAEGRFPAVALTSVDHGQLDERSPSDGDGFAADGVVGDVVIPHHVEWVGPGFSVRYDAEYVGGIGDICTGLITAHVFRFIERDELSLPGYGPGRGPRRWIWLHGGGWGDGRLGWWWCRS